MFQGMHAETQKMVQKAKIQLARVVEDLKQNEREKTSLKMRVSEQEKRISELVEQAEGYKLLLDIQKNRIEALSG